MINRRFTRIETALPGPKSAAVFAEKEKYVAAPIATYAPFVIKESQGAIIEDLDGNRFVDFSGGWGCLNVGQRHERVVAALHDQVDHFLHTDFTAVPYAPFADLARLLCEHVPGAGPYKAAFFNSGAEAVENAVKIARVYTKRNAVLVFENAFHGRTLLTMTMTHKAMPYKAGFGPFASDVYRLPYPYTYRKDVSADDIEQALLALVDPSDVAVMVVEPVIGEGGFLVPPAWFLPAMRNLADKYGFVLALDEVQSGIGRTGKFFAYEHFGIEPDLICVAKSLAAGLPLSGVVGKAEIKESSHTRAAERFELSKVLDVGRDRRFLVFCGFSFLLFLVMGQFASTLSVFSTEFVGISDVHLGFLYTLNGIIVVLFQWPAALLGGKIGTRRALTLGAILFAAGYFTVGLAHSFYFLLGTMVLITLGEVVFSPSATTAVANSATEGKMGRYMGFFGLAEAFGWSAGPFIGGWLLDYFGKEPLILWGAIAAIAATAAIGFSYSGRVRKQVV